MIVAQVFLGAATIWTGKKADIATAHVACGALSLAMGALISIISFRGLAAPAGQNCPAQENELTSLFSSSRITPSS
jgi:heme A synthase